MRMSWLVCVLLGTLAWGQAAQSAPPPPAQGAATNTPARISQDGSAPVEPAAEQRNCAEGEENEGVAAANLSSNFENSFLRTAFSKKWRRRSKACRPARMRT